MKTEELRAIQAPLKEHYREQPEAALITLKAQGRLGEGVTCSVQTGKALVEAGLHPATGGDGLSLCSGDMLLEALAACAGVTLNAVATAIGVELRDAVVRAEGDLDFRGTLGVAKDAPVGFRDIRLHFALDTDATADQRATLVRLTERYCVVLSFRHYAIRRPFQWYRDLRVAAHASGRHVLTGLSAGCGDRPHRRRGDLAAADSSRSHPARPDAPGGSVLGRMRRHRAVRAHR